ncbi:MAG: prolipoprotein diacylglyceryl transferase [Planctomycetes bacterium]|nr:prolipoprotein diacylglyceryl transferase [Planctomycetota bacterium]
MAESGHWQHDIDPFIVHFWGEVGIRWYGMAYVAGIVCGYWLLKRWSQRDRLPVAGQQLQDFGLFAGLSMIAGGRLGYLVFYAFDKVLQDPLYALRLWEGGMSSHGGIIGFAVGIWWWARRHGRSFPVLGDAVCTVGTIGVFFGRLANFINGELWGRPSTVPWAVIFPEAGMIPRHPSQLYAAVAEGLLPFLLLLTFHARHRRPGLTMAAFLTLYAVGRFVGEFFREPDNNRFLVGWLTKGQALTIPLALAAIAFAIYALRRPPLPELYLAPAAPSKPA